MSLSRITGYSNNLTIAGSWANSLGEWRNNGPVPIKFFKWSLSEVALVGVLATLIIETIGRVLFFACTCCSKAMRSKFSLLGIAQSYAITFINLFCNCTCCTTRRR